MRAWGTASVKVSVRRLAAALSEGNEQGALSACGGEKAWSEALSSTLRTYSRPVFVASADVALSVLPMRSLRQPLTVSLTVINALSVQWADRQAAKLVSGLDREARMVLREMMSMAVEQGLTVDMVARMIQRHRLVGLLPKQASALRKYRKRLLDEGLDPDTIARRIGRHAEAQLRSRAMTIARTELLAASNAGQQAAWEQAVAHGLLPKTVQRVWIVTMDDMLCEHTCQPLMDAVAPIGQPFPGGIMHPPAHPRCRCAMGLTQGPKR